MIVYYGRDQNTRATAGSTGLLGSVMRTVRCHANDMASHLPAERNAL